MCIIIHAPLPIVNRFDEICRKISKNAAVTAWFCVECDITSVANALWHCVAWWGGGEGIKMCTFCNLSSVQARIGLPQQQIPPQANNALQWI